MPTQAFRFYQLLLKIYPAEHQREYAELMAQAFNDLYRQTANNRPTLWDWIAFWTHILNDTVISASIEHYQTIKEGIMNKNLLRKPITLQFLPLIAILAIMLVLNRNIDFAAIYISLFIASGIGWGLGRMGFIPHSTLWINYAKGIFAGFVGIAIVVLGSMSSSAIIDRNLTPWTVLAIAVGIYANSLFIIHRLVYRLDRTLWAISLFLPVIALISVELSLPAATTQELNQTYRLLALAFSLIQVLAVMAATILTLKQPKKSPTPIPMMVAGGMIYTAYAPGYFTGEANVWISLTIAFFPLIITPLWWLSATTERARIWGTFILWLTMFAVTTMLTIAGRVSSDLSPIITTVFIVVVPLIVMMWVILQRTSSSTTAEATETYSTSKPAKAHAAKR